jgi:fructose-1,6-bisphosphatase I
MEQLGTTVTEYILDEQAEAPEATGAFTSLLSELIVAAKIISRETRKAGLLDVLGATGERNVQGERVQKLDDYGNNVIISRMSTSGHLCAMVSEEVADVIEIPDRYAKGNYILIFDPVDGSSNIDANVSIGTIFSIYRRVSQGEGYTMADVLQPGRNQVAAGYIIYGSSTMLVYTVGNGVHGFTLDPSVGEFLLSHEHITIPDRGKIFSVNEGNYYFWDEDVRSYIDHLKGKDGSKPYSSRYIGSLVADFHRNMLYGGIFMYPADSKDPRKPTGKLRLMCECNPLAYVCEQAGGSASTGGMRILDIEPLDIHQRVPLYIGSKRDVEEAETYLRGERPQ